MKALTLHSNWDNAPAKASKAAPRPVPVSTWLGRPVSGMDQPLFQRKCACGGGCPACQEQKSPETIQTKLAVSTPGDPFELEADQVADQIMRMPAPMLQRQCKSSRSPTSGAAAQTASADLSASADVSAIVAHGTSGGGHPLDASTRTFMEQRFQHDFSAVRAHTDNAAAESAQALNSNAYTIGNSIVFGAGKYQPQTAEGKRLMAHELAHAVQQQAGIQTALIQRDCSDPDFCQPYPTAADAASAEATIRSWYLPVEETKFGATSRSLYESFLSRSPGDSLTPVNFDTPGTDIVSSFAESGATADDQDAILDLIGARLSRAPGPLRDYTPTTMSVENFLSRTELDNRPINYSNPFSIAGHIAGGIGSSDAGDDYRKVLWGNVTLERIPLVGGTGYVHAETTLHYEVFDAIDFCPGDCGSPAEQLVTVPMSRLEASGAAYDVPFKVTFVPESRSKRFFYS